MSLTHVFVSGKADGADATQIQPSHFGSAFTVGPTHAFSGGALGSVLYRDTGASDGSSWLAAATGVLAWSGAGVAPTVTASPTLTGTNFTALNATQLTTGTIPDARFPATLPAASGANLTSIPVAALTGTVAVAQGGTGLASYAIGDLLYASGATTLAKLADVATGSVLISGGVGAAPAWSVSPSVTNITVATLVDLPYTPNADTDGAFTGRVRVGRYSIKAQATTPGGGQGGVNRTAQFGYNLAGGIGSDREDVSLPTFGIAFESNAPAVQNGAEHHWYYTTAAGVPLRFMTTGINLTTHLATINFNTDGTNQDLSLAGRKVGILNTGPLWTLDVAGILNVGAAGIATTGTATGDIRCVRLGIGKTPTVALDIASGVVLLPSGGSAAGPVLAFPNATGLFNPADGILAFTAGGTEIGRMGGAGNPWLVKRSTNNGVAGDLQLTGAFAADSGGASPSTVMEMSPTYLGSVTATAVGIKVGNAAVASWTTSGIFIVADVAQGLYTPTGAASGDAVLPNARALRARNAAGSGTIIVAGLNASNHQRIDYATQSTVGAAGGASALPATPTGFAIVDISGTEFVMPYYAKA